MKQIVLLIFMFPIVQCWAFQNDTIQNIQETPSQEELNKKIALGFYNDLWATDNTDNYSKYVADTYVVHDIGDRKNVTEPAIEQKIIADRFWDGGKMDLEFDWQIAEGDLVATRWTFNYKAESFMSKLIFGNTSIPIINVFRIQDGKIVEIWNHRHDIDTQATNLFVLKGLGFGLIIALIPSILAIRYRRKLKNLRSN